MGGDDGFVASEQAVQNRGPGALEGGVAGGDTELAGVERQLRSGAAVAICALNGMGGVGKSALAATLTAKLASDDVFLPGGVAWIACENLTGASGLAEVWTRVARARGLSQLAEEPNTEKQRAGLNRALAAAPRLFLALDNVEPGLPVPKIVSTLAVPDHTVLLLTARQSLDDAVPYAIQLPPLPDADAARLFRLTLSDRHRERNDGSPPRPTPDDERHIGAIVADLDGLPLAIELTAAYAGKQELDLAVVEREIQADALNYPALNPTDNADQPASRALRARFDRSWAALAPVPRRQRLFAGLSLLAGANFPREAAYALAAAAGLPPTTSPSPEAPLPDASAPLAAPPDPRADIAALVDYALVVALPGNRLRLHPLLRQYAASRLRTLGPAVEAPLGDAMIAFWLAYARKHPGYEGMDALEAEADGLMGALEWAHSHERWHDVIEIAKQLGTRWHVRGRRAEEQRMFTLANSAAQAMNDPGEEWRFEHQLAALHASLGQLVEARAGYTRALALAQQLHDPAAEQAEVHELAVLDSKTGHLAEARAGYTRALALAQQLHDPAAEQAELHALAVLDAQTGHLAAARAGYTRALALAQQLHDPAAERAELHELAVLDDKTGQLAEARAGFARALALAQQLGDPAAEAAELCNFGIFLAQQFGETDKGRVMIGESLALSENLHDIYAAGKCHQFLAWIDRDAGNRAGAIAHFREALHRFEQVDSPDAGEVRADLLRLGVKL